MGSTGNFKHYLALLVLCSIFFSCTVVKDFPEKQPFVFNNEINLTGSVSKDENKRLTNDLTNYWDDSLYARKIQQFGVRYVLKNPPVFDTVNLARTKLFMAGYLYSQGYFSPKFINIDSSFSFDTIVKNNKMQIRTTIALQIDPGKNTIIDSLSYNIDSSYLDSLSLLTINKSFIKPGKTILSKQVIASELDRLVAVFRQKGFFLLTRDDVVAEVDTTDNSLSHLAPDSLKLAKKIAEAEERRKQNLISVVEIKKRATSDSTEIPANSTHFKPYYVGNIFFYPETGRYDIPDSLIIDTALFFKYRLNYSTLYFKEGLFKFKPLNEHTYQQKGLLYNEENFYKTLNNFNRVGAWERVDYRTFIRNDSIDFHYFLTPAKKETVSFNLETSRNTGDIVSAGNLIGIALNITYLNRNVWHRAIQSATSLSNGIEFSLDKSKTFLQTIQSSINHTLNFPYLISPFKIIHRYRLEGVRTQLTLSASYSDRKDFFRLRSFVGGWGYEWRKNNIVWQYKPLNIELYSLDTLHLLDSAFATNPFLRTSFNTGSVVSQQLSFNLSYAGKNTNTTHYIRIALEEAGALLGRIKSLQDNIYQYIKLEAEYQRHTSYRKTELAFRLFGGIGYNYSNDAKFGTTLPFFKQYVAGGPNSMRAWGLRLLGLGSSIVSDTAELFRDRYGDMQLESNAEFRFTLAQLSSVKMGGAFFTDIGNIWNLHRNRAAPNSEFSFNRLAKDIAIGIGTGVRFDFNYFLIRVDLGIKLKDPARFENNGWLSLSDFTWKNYEYTDKGAPARNNYAIQLGIGLPF